MSIFLNALFGTNNGRPPIWLMRQAGRYMPAYQKLRTEYGLNAMFREPELIIQTTLFPIVQLNVDAAILFADILTVLEGLGKKWELIEGVGPVIEPIFSPSDLIFKNSEEAYPHIKKALMELKMRLKCPLIGFCGGPLTIAAYLIEGKMTKEMQILKRWIYTNPVDLHHVLQIITKATIDYLQLQIDCGIDVIQIFDSWAGHLTPSAFHEFVLPYLKQLIEHFSKKIPIIIFSRGSCLYIQELISLKPQAISFDWQQEMEKLERNVPSNIALQGNLDPCILLGSKIHIQKQTDRLLSQMKNCSRFIFNLGHGILPQTPFENVQYLVDYVKSF